MSKPSLLAWEQGVDNRFNTSVDQSFEDLVGDAEQGDGTIALWVLYRFLWLWDRNYKCHMKSLVLFLQLYSQAMEHLFVLHHIPYPKTASHISTAEGRNKSAIV